MHNRSLEALENFFFGVCVKSTIDLHRHYFSLALNIHVETSNFGASHMQVLRLIVRTN